MCSRRPRDPLRGLVRAPPSTTFRSHPGTGPGTGRRPPACRPPAAARSQHGPPRSPACARAAAGAQRAEPRPPPIGRAALVRRRRQSPAGARRADEQVGEQSLLDLVGVRSGSGELNRTPNRRAVLRHQGIRRTRRANETRARQVEVLGHQRRESRAIRHPHRGARQMARKESRRREESRRKPPGPARKRPRCRPSANLRINGDPREKPPRGTPLSSWSSEATRHANKCRAGEPTDDARAVEPASQHRLDSVPQMGCGLPRKS